MSSRARILGKLRGAARPFPAVAPLEYYRPTVPLDDHSPSGLRTRFLQEARRAACVVHEPLNEAEAIGLILALLGADRRVSCWDLAHIPLPGLGAALAVAGIQRVGQDAEARVGLTGADGALAATGSLVLLSGNGRYRAASLLPLVHIAVITADQILPDLESWFAQQKSADFRRRSNAAIITGPSRTADIAMQLVMGMHGPHELQLLCLPAASQE